MGQSKPGLCGVSTPHCSWSNELSNQLNNAVRNYLIQQQTEYVSHTVESFIHSNRQTHESYYKVITYKTVRQTRRPNTWYVCQPANQACTNTSI